MNKIRSYKVLVFGTLMASLALSTAVYGALAIHGAIYTTLRDGGSVNHNIYGDEEDVYLNGGPNNNSNRGLPPGDYYFQVTDPSGKVLLSEDEAECRILRVNANGRVDGVSPDAQCGGHKVGLDPLNNTQTVQLYPFDSTPNPGGEYKAWLIPVGAATVDANDDRVLNFKHSNAKTDNFKVLGGVPD